MKTKILIVSDSHGNADALEAILSAEKADIVIHCGDGCSDSEILSCRVLAVRGNVDVTHCHYDSEIICEIAGRKIFVTHGDGYGVKSTLFPLVSRAKAVGATYVFFGHTHRQMIETVEGITMVNPGCARSFFYAVCETGNADWRFSLKSFA